MDSRAFGRWLAAPFRAVIGPFTLFFVAVGFVLWIAGFMLEKTTGYQALPEWMAPARKTVQQQIAEDEVTCGMYNVMVDTKAVVNKTKVLEDKVIKTLLNHKYVHSKSLCTMLYEMDVLRPPGKVRKGVPSRQDWVMVPEFSLQGKRKRAMAQRIREIEAQGYGHKAMHWTATQYIRVDRPRTLGNQTEEEKREFRDTSKFTSLGVEEGFEFFAPR